VNVDLSTDTPASPERTRQVAEFIAEAVRYLNHATMDHAAFGSPDDARRVLQEIATAAFRLPQLFGQVDRWLEREDEAERISVPSGQYRDNPLLAVATARDVLDTARADAARLSEDLERAARVTSDLAGVEDGDDA
jgi:hypothetical protein